MGHQIPNPVGRGHIGGIHIALILYFLLFVMPGQGVASYGPESQSAVLPRVAGVQFSLAESLHFVKNCPVNIRDSTLELVMTF